MRTPANQGIFRVQCQIENVSIIEVYFADDFHLCNIYLCTRLYGTCCLFL